MIVPRKPWCGTNQSLSSFFSFLCGAHLMLQFFKGLCVITCLYVHAHAKCACNTWHVLYVSSSPPSIPIHQYAATYYHLTLNEQIHHCLHFFCDHWSKLIEHYPMPHNYIIWIAQWALQNQSVKKEISCCTKRRTEVWKKR